MVSDVVQSVMYGNVETDVDGRRHDDEGDNNTVYANIQPSASSAAAAAAVAEPQNSDVEASQRVVYSRLYSD